MTIVNKEAGTYYCIKRYINIGLYIILYQVFVGINLERQHSRRVIIESSATVTLNITVGCSVMVCYYIDYKIEQKVQIKSKQNTY